MWMSPRQLKMAQHVYNGICVLSRYILHQQGFGGNTVSPQRVAFGCGETALPHLPSQD